MTTYWTKVLTAEENKSVKMHYQYFFNCHRNGWYKHPWLKYIENILNSWGLSFVWASQNFLNNNWIKAIVKYTLNFKTSFGFEDFLIWLPKDLRNVFVKFRTNHRLPIETDRTGGVIMISVWESVYFVTKIVWEMCFTIYQNAPILINLENYTSIENISKP